MNHKTKWEEVQHLTWVCRGCLVQCFHCGAKPKQEEDCDSSIDRIREILFGACYKKEVINE